jgi:L-asparagine transporter-like permease
MAERAGIPVLPGIINFVMIIATISVATADIYVTVSPIHSWANYRIEQVSIRNVLSWLHGKRE